MNKFSPIIIVEYVFLLLLFFMIMGDWEWDRFYQFIKSSNVDIIFGLIIGFLFIIFSNFLNDKIIDCLKKRWNIKTSYSIKFLLKISILWLICKIYAYCAWLIMVTSFLKRRFVATCDTLTNDDK
ncbi:MULTISPECIES: hypothetical protein [Moraxella]|jgi:hypothetical protein|uniref:Uncharacterized protein n=1 Tax=Moraxella lacunata TaxID=477 RepID=A0A1B8PWB4_MORLA|nr:MULTISPECIES: hypothetical protein [Moraxella]MBE9577734.1 hypothetical protein [Moraxella sp. K1664]MBE9587156.1 hypothetical protein [Moraxella sp. K1630]MDH9217899.1 hypothetical protein [Moraxella lacunata]MDI4506381.1 hypothetical protein [Moraxella lacunata]OBX60241.1 hypothetical protein A9309_09635 [Moraxella lacunata]